MSRITRPSGAEGRMSGTPRVAGVSETSHESGARFALRACGIVAPDRWMEAPMYRKGSSGGALGLVGAARTPGLLRILWRGAWVSWHHPDATASKASFEWLGERGHCGSQCASR